MRTLHAPSICANLRKSADANFNVTAVTDDTGGVLERYAYTPYGVVTFLYENFSLDADQKSDIGNNHLYTGRERDPETGLQLNRQRFYDPPLGRWLTRDPIGYEAGDANLYGYVGAHPTRFVDPTGLFGGPLPAPDSPLWPHNRQKKLKDLCKACKSCSQKQCEDLLDCLSNTAKNCPTPSGRDKCEKWANDFGDRICGDCFGNGLPESHPCVDENNQDYFSWFIFGGHAAHRIRICGKDVYFDYGWTGIGFPGHSGTVEDKPPWLLPPWVNPINWF